MNTPEPRPRTSKFWLAVSGVLTLALLLGGAATMSLYEQMKAQLEHLQSQVATTPQVRYIAVLLDDQQLPALLVTLDPRSGLLELQRLNNMVEGREDTMQLWALSTGHPPRSLGVIQSKIRTAQLPTTESALKTATQLAVSVEIKGGVPETVGPRQPYLFKGWLVQRAI
ncbi:anti-sigma factor domain-containing protein [Hydrogenophaga sp.]|jgi:anti-sigma-K factor RskA|uniref:anti-sigma factor domain-containing protein n=1 Tax=Hydrogenophaga sp. TaxID=1904254 RepID=UPI003F6E454E